MIIIKIAKAHSIWVFEVGTCRGHKPIIDQSCGAVFFPDSSHRDLSASNLPGLIQWIYDPVMPEILANLKSPTSRFCFEIRIFNENGQITTLYHYADFTATLQSLIKKNPEVAQMMGQ